MLRTQHTLCHPVLHSQLWLLSVWHGGEGAVCKFKHACTDRYMSACVFWDRVLLFCPGCPQTLCVTGGNTWVKAWTPNFSFSASKHWDAGVSYWTQRLPAFSSWNFCLLSIKQPRGFTHAKQTLVIQSTVLAPLIWKSVMFILDPACVVTWNSVPSNADNN